ADLAVQGDAVRIAGRIRRGCANDRCIAVERIVVVVKKEGDMVSAVGVAVDRFQGDGLIKADLGGADNARTDDVSPLRSGQLEGSGSIGASAERFPDAIVGASRSPDE